MEDKMKKALSLALFACLLSIQSFASAQDAPAQDDRAGMMRGRMMGKGAMHPMMMGMMGARAITTLDDGSIVVLTANKLIKYDADLNLVKEVDIVIDTQGMQQMMQNCPMADGTEQENTPGPQGGGQRR